MKYIIQELKGEELAEHPKEPFLLLEMGYKPLKLGHYETQEAALKSQAQWIARDNLGDDIAIFNNKVQEKYGNVLDEEEIVEMIKEYS